MKTFILIFLYLIDKSFKTKKVANQLALHSHLFFTLFKWLNLILNHCFTFLLQTERYQNNILYETPKFQTNNSDNISNVGLHAHTHTHNAHLKRSGVVQSHTSISVQSPCWTAIIKLTTAVLCKEVHWTPTLLTASSWVLHRVACWL